jgi:hypothetical protein
MKQDLERTYKRLRNQNKNVREAKDNVVSELSWVADYFLLQTRSSLAESRIHSRVKTIWD